MLSHIRHIEPELPGSYVVVCARTSRNCALLSPDLHTDNVLDDHELLKRYRVTPAG